MEDNNLERILFDCLNEYNNRCHNEALPIAFNTAVKNALTKYGEQKKQEGIDETKKLKNSGRKMYELGKKEERQRILNIIENKLLEYPISERGKIGNDMIKFIIRIIENE